MSKHHLTEISFDSLPLENSLQRALKDSNFEFCTPIQAESLPVLLINRDCAGQAQTGTGKTLAFLLGSMQRLLSQPEIKTLPGKPKVLILAPTRELALQIYKDAELLVKHNDLKLAICYGGKAYEQQKSQFEKPVDILIGTPGRLIDFLKQKLYTLKFAQCLILDEADRMFDMGFINDVRFMLRRLPPPDKRLSMLFSATMAQKVMELAYEHMNNAKLIKIESDSPAVERIVQTMYHPANDEKIPLLLGLIKKFQPVRSIIFVNTKHAAIRVWEYLMSNGHPSALISGDIQQSKRESLLKKFHDGEYSFLVATDVASRGLHIPDVTHVFNYDLPDLGEDDVHRIGRTARVGNEGHAISFACEDFAMNLMDIESYIEKSVPNESITSELLIKPTPRKRLMKQKPRGKPQGGRGRPHHSQGQQRNNNNNRNSNSQRRRRPPNKSNQSTQKSD